mmetsp:Transcript_4625/g.13467  ORF Transcript_4625/g.13467 Transcript_4625/m.13467 type:complete len:339 (-) Transcript_4625:2223-3239(-)
MVLEDQLSGGASSNRARAASSKAASSKCDAQLIGSDERANSLSHSVAHRLCANRGPLASNCIERPALTQAASNISAPFVDARETAVSITESVASSAQRVAFAAMHASFEAPSVQARSTLRSASSSTMTPSAICGHRFTKATRSSRGTSPRVAASASDSASAALRACGPSPPHEKKVRRASTVAGWAKSALSKRSMRSGLACGSARVASFSKAAPKDLLWKALVVESASQRAPALSRGASRTNESTAAPSNAVNSDATFDKSDDGAKGKDGGRPARSASRNCVRDAGTSVETPRMRRSTPTLVSTSFNAASSSAIAVRKSAPPSAGMGGGARPSRRSMY